MRHTVSYLRLTPAIGSVSIILKHARAWFAYYAVSTLWRGWEVCQFPQLSIALTRLSRARHKSSNMDNASVGRRREKRSVPCVGDPLL